MTLNENEGTEHVAYNGMDNCSHGHTIRWLIAHIAHTVAKPSAPMTRGATPREATLVTMTITVDSASFLVVVACDLSIMFVVIT